MTEPHELKLDLAISLSNAVKSTTGKLWQVLVASKNGDLETIKVLAEECPGIVYAQYNYTPPIHFAVREGHAHVVKYLLTYGAYDPAYKTYPFGESLETIAADRDYEEIRQLLEYYSDDLPVQSFKGDNGKIHYNRSAEQEEFQDAVSNENLNRTKSILEKHPEFANDQTYFWGEGIMTFAAKYVNKEMVELLSSYGAKVPAVLKWAQNYYFEKLEGASLMMENGMDPNTRSWQEVTLLHDMAQKGDIPKAELLIKYGAALNPIEEEYLSTPLGMAARWGNEEMVEFLLKKGADPRKSGASWSTPLSWAKKKGHTGIIELLNFQKKTQ